MYCFGRADRSLFYGVLKKNLSLGERDHYFLFGSKDAGKIAKGVDQKSETAVNFIKGILVGQIDHGHFRAYWAGKDTIYFDLQMLNKDTTRRFSVLDPYNELNMIFKFSPSIPFIGIQNDSKIETQ